MNHSSLRILLVEDNPLNQKLICLTLAKYGFTIDLTENGSKALIKIKEREYDLILMDIMMPVMDGLEALAEIKKINPDAKVIIVSAMGQEKNVMKAVQLGAKNFVIKPFNAEKVKEAVLQIIN